MTSLWTRTAASLLRTPTAASLLLALPRATTPLEHTHVSITIRPPRPPSFASQLAEGSSRPMTRLHCDPDNSLFSRAAHRGNCAAFLSTKDLRRKKNDQSRISSISSSKSDRLGGRQTTCSRNSWPPAGNVV